MTSSYPRLAGAAGIMIALFGIAKAAQAEDPTKEQCISANEEGQLLRQKGQLQAARSQLLVCVRSSCPTAVRDDCAQRLNDIETAIPTVVFVAKANGETDLSDVKVTMDGKELASRLDGTAIVVEPGEHTFEFTTPGFPATSKKLVIREGEKRRAETVIFGSLKSPIAPPAAAAAHPPPVEPQKASSGDTQRIVGLAVGGAGIIGIGLGAFFGLKAKSTYDEGDAHCPRGPSSCDQQGVDSDKDARSQATVSTVAFIAGGALLAGGVVLFLTAPKDGAVTVSPAVGSTGGGVRLGAAW